MRLNASDGRHGSEARPLDRASQRGFRPPVGNQCGPFVQNVPIVPSTAELRRGVPVPATPVPERA